MMSTKSGTPLYGDWRRRRGTKTDAHLYRPRARGAMGSEGLNRLPECHRRIGIAGTVPVEVGRPCTDCLVAGIRAAGHEATP